MNKFRKLGLGHSALTGRLPAETLAPGQKGTGQDGAQAGL